MLNTFKMTTIVCVESKEEVNQRQSSHEYDFWHLTSHIAVLFIASNAFRFWLRFSVYSHIFHIKLFLFFLLFFIFIHWCFATFSLLTSCWSALFCHQRSDHCSNTLINNSELVHRVWFIFGTQAEHVVYQKYTVHTHTSSAVLTTTSDR